MNKLTLDEPATADGRSIQVFAIFNYYRRLSPIPMMNGHINQPLPRLSETLPLEVPDASEWSIDDVVNYFLGVGFTEQAEVFKEQASVKPCSRVMNI